MKKFNLFKKHDIIKILSLIVFVCALLTWIIPVPADYSRTMKQECLQMGIFDLFNYPINSFQYFGYIALYIILIGGFYGILYKVPAYKNLLEKIASKLKEKSMVSISIIMIVLATITSVCGIQLGLILFFPFIISVILLMGYDKIVAGLTVVGSTMVGLAGSTYGYNNVGIISTIINSVSGKEDLYMMTDDMVLKAIVLVVGLILLIVNTNAYINANPIKSKKNLSTSKDDSDDVEEVEVEVENSEEEENKEEKVVEKKSSTKSTSSKNKSSSSKNKKSKTVSGKKSSKKNNKASLMEDDVIVVKQSADDDDSTLVPSINATNSNFGPLAVILVALLVIVVLSLTSWTNGFGLDIMTKATEWINDFKVFGFPLFAKLLGTFKEFGTWAVYDLLTVLAVVTILVSIIYKVKLNDIIDGFVAGAKKALYPAIVSLLVYVVLILSVNHQFQMTIYDFIFKLTSKFNVFTTTLIAIISSFFGVEASYAFQIPIPYLLNGITNTEVYRVIALIFQSVYGLAMVIVPTSVILMTTLAYLGVSYKDWLKNIWKFVLEFLVALLIIFTIMVL